MTTFTDFFGGSNVYPSDVSLLAIALTADVRLEWPLETAASSNLAARIIDVTPDANGHLVYLPDATQASVGETLLFNNLSGSYSFTVVDAGGNTIASVAFGTQWQVYLAVNTTANGTWRVVRFGASTATVQPSALAGFGLIPTSSTLSVAMPVTTFSTSGTTVATSNRGGALVWTGSGTGTLNLLTAASAANNFFVAVSNNGGGDLTIDPAGAETINGATTLTLKPGDSAQLITDGTKWYTIGYGQNAVFAFDYTSITVNGGTKTLAGTELNRIAYKFVGVLASNETIVVPSTVQQYWIDNATTGAFTLSLKTATSGTVTVPQGSRGIYYCDGSSVVKADTASIATPFAISDGGTGATTASAARLSLGITAFADAIVTATTAAGVRTTIAAAASGANGDITSLTGLTTALSIGQGGTGATTAGGARTAISAASSGANGDITSLTGLTTPLSAAQGGTGLGTGYAVGDLVYASATATLARLADVATGNVLLSGGVGVAPSYGKVGLTTHISGTLAVGNGGTGAATLTGILVGNGASAFTAVTAPSGTIVGTSDTQTLSNKRIDPRVTTVASSATPTPSPNTEDLYILSALAVGATFAAPGGTPSNGFKLMIRIKDNGGAQTLAWNAIYRAIGVTLPTTTVAGKTLYVGCVYNSADTKWDVVSVAQEA